MTEPVRFDGRAALTPFSLRLSAKEAWTETPKGGSSTFEGSPMGLREADFRRHFVEPTVRRITEAYKRGELTMEEVRQAAEACLSPLPSRRNIRPTRMRLTEYGAIAELSARGLACRSSEQVANGAMTDLPWVGDVAAANGIEIVDGIDDEGDDDEVEDIETDLL